MEPTPKDIKTLLTILRYYISRNGLDDSGMCDTIRARMPKDNMSDSERQRLLEYLSINSPEGVVTGTRRYWWPRGEAAPRLKWLDEQIEKQNTMYEKAALQGWPLTPEEDEIDIPILEGYEIDKNKSSSGNIVLKKIKSRLPITWEELKEVWGAYVNDMSEPAREGKFGAESCNKNVWPTKKEAEASLAMAQLCQLRDRYNGQQGVGGCDYFVYCKNAKNTTQYACYVLSFKTAELRNQFTDNFRDLIEQAAPLL